MDETELLAAVDLAFQRTGAGLDPWPDPHSAGESPADVEYSRVTNPERFRLLSARFEAWVEVLTNAGVANIEREVEITWQEKPGPVLTRTDRLVPVAGDGLRIVVGKSTLAGLDEIGLVIGVGDPALRIGWLPHCGCDACDSGSEYEIEQLDEWINSIVHGVFRHLSRGDQTITVTAPNRFVSSGVDPGQVARVLARSRGWQGVSGTSWFG